MSAMALLEIATQAITTSSDAYELCRNFVHSNFGDVQTTGAQIVAVDQKGMLRQVASYGAVQVLGDEVSLWDDNPIAKAISAKSLDSIPMGTAHLTILPFYKDMAPVGALVLTTTKIWGSNLLDDSGERIIAKLGAFYLDTNGLNIRQSVMASEGNPHDLTERQTNVLNLMALGQTNAEIARALLLSESTIRQETVKIYRALGVNSRAEASKKAKALGLIGKNQGLQQAS